MTVARSEKGLRETEAKVAVRLASTVVKIKDCRGWYLEQVGLIKLPLWFC